MTFKRHHKTIPDKGLRATALSLIDEARCRRAGAAQAGPLEKADFVPGLEARIISAAWTLRRLPDREAGFLRLRGALWPETAAGPGTYAAEGLTTVAARRRVRITGAEIDNMQPSLDLLRLLPDAQDRRLLFWAAWHQDGEKSMRIPWAKVRRSLWGNQAGSLSRWTLKRRYAESLDWLAALIMLQQIDTI